MFFLLYVLSLCKNAQTLDTLLHFLNIKIKYKINQAKKNKLNGHQNWKQ